MSLGSPPNALRGRDATRGAAGRYGFVAEIARGYLGTLWVARDPSDPTATAFVRHVTPITSESTRSALLEAARAAIVAGAETLEVHEAKTGVDIVSPFEDGEVLRTLLRTAALRHATPAPEVLIGLAADIAAQLHDLHTSGDGSLAAFGGLHADSVLVGTDGGVRMLDAGASVIASGLEPWRSDPQRVGYFAPEQIEAKGALDARTDVFALGILLWEAFANRRLFPGNDARSARERVLRAPIPRLDATQKSAASAVATPIADLVAKALSREPAGRFQSMEEMSEALAAIERAGVPAIGEWVTGLSGAVIEKRRTLLERSGGSHSAAHVASQLAQSASVAPPPSEAAPPAPLVPAASPVPAVSPAPAVAATPRAPAVAATPKPPEASATPAPPRTTSLDAFFESEAPPPAALEAEAESLPPEAESVPPEAESVPPEGAAAEAIAAAPAVTGPESTEPVVVPSTPAPPEAAAAATAEPALPSEEPPSGPRAAADSEEAIDVGDSDLTASDSPPARKSAPPPPPPPSLKRPPRLPEASATPTPGGHAEEDVLGGQHSASLASPVAVSQLGALTQKPAESRATWIVAAIAALLLGVGAMFLLKGRGEAPADHAAAPREETKAQVQRKEAPAPAPKAEEAPAAAAPPEPPAPVAVPPVEVGASEPSPPKAESPKGDEPKAPPPKAAEPPAEKPKPVATRDTPPARPRPTETGTHRPPPSRSSPGSTYKPGGI